MTSPKKTRGGSAWGMSGKDEPRGGYVTKPKKTKNPVGKGLPTALAPQKKKGLNASGKAFERNTGGAKGTPQRLWGKTAGLGGKARIERAEKKNEIRRAKGRKRQKRSAEEEFNL